MTDEQYLRWRDFALRMARTCFSDSRRPNPEWIIEKVESWFFWRDYQKDWREYNSWDQDEHPLCDHISEFYDDLGPQYIRCKACAHDCRSQWPHYEKTCPLCELECRCAVIEHMAWEQFQDQWMSPILCCIRAGIDMACERSAGVLGFTAGDLRRMYPEGVPEWVFQPHERLGYLFSDELNGTFSELPDDAHVCL